VTLIKNTGNFGFARAVNTGIRVSRGKYVYILNQDLRFRPGSTRVLLERLQTEPHLGMIGPKFVGFDGTIQRSARCLPGFRHVLYDALLLARLLPKHREFASWRMGWFDHETETYVEQPLGSAMLIPREMIEKVGFLDERFPIFFNDVDFCRRLKDAGYNALYCPSAVVEHHHGASTRVRPIAMLIESHRSMYRYLAKYAKWYEYPLLWLCGVLLLLGLIPRALAVLFRTDST
jgi:GT2 family glycosyltransferase